MSSENHLGKKVLFTLSAVAAGAALAIRSISEKRKQKQNQVAVAQEDREKWAKYKEWGELQSGAVVMDKLQALTFKENSEHMPHKTPKGFQPEAYKNRTAAVGTFAVMEDPEIAYYLFQFCQLHEVVMLQGVCKAWKDFMVPLLEDREYLKLCAYQGFTSKNYIRGYCWKVMCQAPLVTDKKRKMYHTLWEQVGIQDSVIGRDGDRTLIHHDYFIDDDEAVKVLTRMLKAYAVHDPGVGYTQGMNFLAAFLLIHLPETEAYWMLYHMLLSKNMKLRNLYTHGLPTLKLAQYQFQRLFEWYLPKLADHFEKEMVHIDFFLTEWMMTLFTYKCIPPETSGRIWDIFMIDGWKSLFRFGLAILSLSQSTLLQYKFEDMVKYLKFYPDQAIFVPEILLNKAQTFKVTNSLLHRLSVQFYQEYVVVKQEKADS